VLALAAEGAVQDFFARRAFFVGHEFGTRKQTFGFDNRAKQNGALL
jgi:hypothetical protein